MKARFFVLALILLSIDTYSQMEYEKAYFINNADERVECFIKNKDWARNPTKFDYRITLESEKKTENINKVKEFGVYNYSKYIRFNVEIDRSSNHVSKLNLERRPIFQEETLFLKLLVEGKANLYVYSDQGGDLRRYFFNVESSKVQQLIYKRYLMSNADDIMKNERYKQQLKVFLACEKILEKDLEKMDYIQSDLMNLFFKYNNCDNQNPINNKITDDDSLNLSVVVGVRNASFVVENSGLAKGDFGNSVSFSLGMDLEYIFPFNKKHFSFFVEPTYQYYKPASFLYLQTSANDYYAIMDYKSLEIPFGFRYYKGLSSSSQFFLEVAGVADYPAIGKSKVIFEHGFNPIYTARNSFNLAYGAGIRYLEKFILKIKYGAGRPVITTEPSMTARYKYLSATIGYTFF